MEASCHFSWYGVCA